MSDWVLAEDLKEIAIELKDKYPTTLENVEVDKIVFLRELSSDKSRAYAYTKRIEPIYKVINSAYDYLIVFFDKLIVDFTPAQLNVLVLHELMHIGGTEIDNKGNEKTKMIKHNVEDFFEIITAFGADWATNDSCRDPLAEIIEIKPAPKPTDGLPGFVDEE